MTERDSRPSSSAAHAAEQRADSGCAPPAVRVDVVADVAEKLRHGAASMVSRDVRVEVLPDALDAVRIWAVGRQEVQDDASSKGGQGLASLARLVDAPCP